MHTAADVLHQCVPLVPLLLVLLLLWSGVGPATTLRLCLMRFMTERSLEQQALSQAVACDRLVGLVGFNPPDCCNAETLML